MFYRTSITVTKSTWNEKVQYSTVRLSCVIAEKATSLKTALLLGGEAAAFACAFEIHVVQHD